MRLRGLAAQPAPEAWSTSGLLFLDPAVMSEHDIRPGQPAFLEVRGDCYPLRTGLPRKELFNSQKVEIDHSIWRMISGDLRSNSFSVVIEPDELLSLTVVHLHIDEETFAAVDRDNFEQVVKVKGYPAREGYRLSLMVEGQMVFFEVRETSPLCGGIIAGHTQIFLEETELRSFKLIHMFRRQLDEALQRIARLQAEINELVVRARCITREINRFSNSQLRLRNLRQERERLEVRINRLMVDNDQLTRQEGELEAYISAREADEGHRKN